MLPPLDRPPETTSHDQSGSTRADLIESQIKSKPTRYGRLIVVLIILGLIGWGAWKILPYIPGIPQYVRLKSATYLRSAHVYRYDTAVYNPDQAPLAPEWTSLVIDTGTHQATFQSSAGGQISVSMGESQYVNACENQFLVETFPLPEHLTLGSTTFQKPVLIVACEMWAVGEKVRPARLVVKEGPLSPGNAFFSGMECHPQQERCMSFAEFLNNLSLTVIDADTKQALPEAQITLSSGLGIQEYSGSFRLPIYAAMQVEYKVSLAGYADKSGQISNFYANKLEIMYWTDPEHSRGSGNTLDLPVDGQEVNFSMELTKN